MSSAMQKAASLLGAAEVFHVLADAAIPALDGRARPPSSIPEILAAARGNEIHWIRLGGEPGWPQLRSATADQYPLVLEAGAPESAASAPRTTCSDSAFGRSSIARIGSLVAGIASPTCPFPNWRPGPRRTWCGLARRSTRLVNPTANGLVACPSWISTVTLEDSPLRAICWARFVPRPRARKRHLCSSWPRNQGGRCQPPQWASSLTAGWGTTTARDSCGIRDVSGASASFLYEELRANRTHYSRRSAVPRQLRLRRPGAFPWDVLVDIRRAFEDCMRQARQHARADPKRLRPAT